MLGERKESGALLFVSSWRKCGAVKIEEGDRGRGHVCGVTTGCYWNRHSVNRHVAARNLEVLVFEDGGRRGRCEIHVKGLT
ncbi:hypothetical protein ACFX2I_001823 [Malus domestica]